MTWRRGAHARQQAIVLTVSRSLALVRVSATRWRSGERQQRACKPEVVVSKHTVSGKSQSEQRNTHVRFRYRPNEFCIILIRITGAEAAMTPETIRSLVSES